MYKCLNCGHIFSEGEQGSYKENVGEYWGCECYEARNCCPVCNGEYEEATKCKFCGGVFLDEELNRGMCEECKDDLKFPYKHDPKKCYELSKDEQEEVSLNAFLVSQYTPEQIEEVLMKDLILSMAEMPPDYSNFIDSDEMWFIEKMLEEVKTDE